MTRLRRIQLKGFKSIREMDLEMRPLNVLIGGNGSGKSNLLSFFALLSDAAEGRLRYHVDLHGGGAAHLHFGAARTETIDATLDWETEAAEARFALRFETSADDRLTIARAELEPEGDSSLLLPETGQGRPSGNASGTPRTTGDGGRAVHGTILAERLRGWIARARPYHFHTTSPHARVKQTQFVGDNLELASDGGNLAPLLLRLREWDTPAFETILSTIRMIAPYFGDFVLEPNGPHLLLRWRHRKTPGVFGAYQLSDGTLRAICLITLLNLPPEMTPELLLIDEPELGLHPMAIQLVASLIRMAAHSGQVLVATQSARFVDEFDPEDIVIADREDDATVFRRPPLEHWKEWLEDYSLSDIWEKNVFGGGIG